MKNASISIITVTFNADRFLEKLIKSVIEQNSEYTEFIIIDGGSKDNTINIVKQYEANITYWVSEPDKGIYDAWNKGVKQSTGDWIMFLGADDILKPDALKKYQNFIKNSAAQNLHYISSRMEMIDADGKFVRVKGWPWEWPSFLKEMMVAHPGSLHSRLLFKEYGYFDINYKISGDYELMLRPRNKLRAAFMNEITTQMSEGGASDSAKAIKEHYRAATITGGGSKFPLKINALYVYTKFILKNITKKLGLKLYLKKSKLLTP